MKDGASPPDVSRGDIINIDAPWDLVEGLAKLSLARYPGADRVIAVDEMGHTKGEWGVSPRDASVAHGGAFTVADDVGVWIADGGSIHIKTSDPHGDPVELAEADAVQLATILMRLADELRA